MGKYGIQLIGKGKTFFRGFYFLCCHFIKAFAEIINGIDKLRISVSIKIYAL